MFTRDTRRPERVLYVTLSNSVVSFRAILYIWPCSHLDRDPSTFII